MRRLRWVIPGSLLALAGFMAAIIAWNFHTFYRLTDEALIARLRFAPVAPQVFQVELRTGSSCEARTFKLFGDEWRVDARFLKWKSWANLAGMDAMYRLERLSGRYRDLNDENARPHVAYAIGQAPAIDLVSYAERDWGRWIPVDTLFGSSVYENIDPAFEYLVYRSQSGLLVRKMSLAPAHYEGEALVIHIEPECEQGP